MEEKKQPTKLEFQELLDACQLTLVGLDFNEKNFPLEPIEPDEDEWTPHEHCFEKAMLGDDALQELKDLGYRFFNGSRRALQYIAGCKKEYTLVIVIPWTDPQNNPCVPLLSDLSYDSMPDWQLIMWRLNKKFEFPQQWRWLVLRKKEKK